MLFPCRFPLGVPWLHLADRNVSLLIFVMAVRNILYGIVCWRLRTGVYGWLVVDVDSAMADKPPPHYFLHI